MTTQRLLTSSPAERSQIHRSHSALNSRQSGDSFSLFDTSSLRKSVHSSHLQFKAASSEPSIQTTEKSTRAQASRSKNHRQKRRSVNLKKAGQNTTAEWTVMVYMAGNNLESYAIQDFLELAAAGSDRKVNIVVQLDRTVGYDSSYGNWADTRRGQVQKGNIPNARWGTSIGEANMGSDTTLKDFVKWGTNTYKAKHYALVMWGHGDGQNVSYDDATKDSVSGGELNSALAGLASKVDLVGTDACLMSTTEFASQISENASVFVGSQELEPGSGWNYTPVLKDLKANPTMTAAQLSSSLVTRYGQTYPSGNETLSSIDLAALRSSNPYSLTNAIDNFAATLFTSATNSSLNTLDAWRDALANDFDTSNQPNDFCDVGKLFSGFASSTRISAPLQAAAQAVVSAYSSAVIQNYTAIVNRSTGLSLYFPDRGASTRASYTDSSSFSTQWSAFLNSELW